MRELRMHRRFQLMRLGLMMAGFAAVLWAGQASADTAVVGDPVSPNAFERIVAMVQGPLIDLIGTGLLALIGMGLVALRSYQGNNAFAKAGSVVATYALNAAKHLLEGMSAEFKSVLADGKVTAAERQQLIDKLQALMLAELPDWVQRVLKSGFGDGLKTVLAGKAAAAVDTQLRSSGVLSVLAADGTSTKLAAPSP